MYIDFHSHFDFYKEDKVEQAIKEIENNNIKIITCSMDINSYSENLRLSNESNNIIPIFGIHPWKVKERFKIFDKLDDYIKNSFMIGEIGLDFHWIEDKSTYIHQVEVFEYFLSKAKQHDKYINIHTKGAEEVVFDLIKKYDLSEKSIIHWYSGATETLKEFVKLNCYFTASVDLQYSEKSRDIVNLIPSDKIIAETDGPTALEWVNGNYGMPSEIINVYESICKVKKIEIEELKENAKKLYCKIK